MSIRTAGLRPSLMSSNIECGEDPTHSNRYSTKQSRKLLHARTQLLASGFGCQSIDRSIDGWMDGFDDIRIAVDGGRDILDGVRSQLPNKQRHGSRVESQSAVVLCLCVCVYNRSATKYCGRHKRRCTLAFNLGHHRTRKNFIGFLEKGRHPSRCTCSYIVVLLVLPGPPIPVLDRMGSL